MSNPGMDADVFEQFIEQLQRYVRDRLLPAEKEIIEDLVKAAHADARRRLDDAMAEAMKQATGGLGGMLPGFKLPF